MAQHAFAIETTGLAGRRLSASRRWNSCVGRSMDLHNDFRELLELFIASNVEFVVVGGYALAHHGAPRFTGDIDLFVRPTRDNAGRVVDALNGFCL